MYHEKAENNFLNTHSYLKNIITFPLKKKKQESERDEESTRKWLTI